MPDFDPFDSTRRDVAYDVMARLRDSCPVSRLDNGFFYFARAADVQGTLRDGGERVRDYSHAGGMRAPGVMVPAEEQLINEIEGPRHTLRRRLLNGALLPSLVARSEPFIRELANRLLDDLVDAGEVDLVERFASPIPGQVFAHVLGLPVEDYPQFKQWSDEVVEGTYPTLNRNERGEGFAGAHPEFAAYLDDQADRRRSEPSNDLLTLIVQAEADGIRFTRTEIRPLVMHLVIAGHETTISLIANLLFELARRPELYHAGPA